jgi:hypothetical protein
MKFVKCPNGNVWVRNEDGQISGSVLVTEFEGKENLESVLDSIAEAATGSNVGLRDIGHSYLGNDLVSFSAVPAILDSDPDECVELHADSPELPGLLAAQYGLDEVEVQHILDNLDLPYEQESVLPILGTGREIRCPAYPAECDYVRIVIDGFELAYWDKAEWSLAPAEVMGAILGAARG